MTLFYVGLLLRRRALLRPCLTLPLYPPCP